MDTNFKNELSHITFSIFLRPQSKSFPKIVNLAENMELKVKFSSWNPESLIWTNISY